jgi:hypothetical protein
VDNVHVDVFIDEFMKEFFGTLNGLHKDEHRWFEAALCNQLPDSNKFAVLFSNVNEALLNVV